MPGLAAFKTRLLAALCAQRVPLTTTARASYDRLAVRCRAPLEIFVFSHQDVLVD